MAKGDRTAQEVRELTAKRDKLIAGNSELRKSRDRQVDSTRKELNRLMAATPREVEQRLQECMMVVREAMEEMDKLSTMLREWAEK
jgi:hypothetical protein